MLPKFKVGDIIISTKYGCICEVMEIYTNVFDDRFRMKVLDYSKYNKLRSDDNTYIINSKFEKEFVLLTDQTLILYGK